MLQSLLAIVAGSDGNYYFDSFGEALIYALIGFVIVFLGIVLIIFIIWLLGLVMRKTDNLAFLTRKKNKDKEAEAENTEQIAGTPVLEEKASQVSGGITEEERAAIIAAVIACLQEEQSECEFVVRRIKRI